MQEKYRVFFGYRNNTDGQKLAGEIYTKIKNADEYEKKYGKPYFSPQTEKGGNFLYLEFLHNVEYFILMYTPDFFEAKTSEKPVVIKEIEEALRFCSNIKFIPVIFPGFDESKIKENYERLLDPSLKERFKLIIGAKLDIRFKPEDANEVIDEICRIIYINEKKEPNVFLSTKKEIESDPLFYRLSGVKKLTLLNYAGTSFITGASVAEIYNDEAKRRFYAALLDGSIEVRVILTEPGSSADIDAGKYKMNPGRLKKEIAKGRAVEYESFDNSELSKHIIAYNFNEICKFKLKNPAAMVSVFYNEIALPYSIMKCEYDDTSRDSMQICIYTPLQPDYKRPAFVLRSTNPATKEIYSVFNDSMSELLKNSVEFTGHPDVSFLFKQPIIHRAKLSDTTRDLTRNAIAACAEKGYPIEIDLLFLDDTVVVWRDEVLGEYDGFSDEINFSDLDEWDLGNIMEQTICDESGCPQIMLLEEMTEMLEQIALQKGEAPISLLVEIKDFWECDEKTIRKHVIKTCDILSKYTGRYAVHAANPNVLKAVKEYDVRIPCGQITLDFDKGTYETDEEYKALHSKAEFYDIVIPDFISCKLGDFEEPFYTKKRESFGIKKLGWVAADLQTFRAKRRQYDNLLIEFELK